MTRVVANDERLLHPIDALRSALERLQELAKTKGRDRELLVLAAGDYVRALQLGRRWMQTVETQGQTVLDEVAVHLGEVTRQGFQGFAADHPGRVMDMGTAGRDDGTRALKKVSNGDGAWPRTSNKKGEVSGQ